MNWRTREQFLDAAAMAVWFSVCAIVVLMLIGLARGLYDLASWLTGIL
jgi:hypothetical protein